MNSEQPVLDTIDALVDAQLQQESSGYDHNINQAECPHEDCAYIDWHGLPLYGCPGSAVHGPVEPRRGQRRKATPQRPGRPITGTDPLEDFELLGPLILTPNPLLQPAQVTLYDADWNEVARDVQMSIVPTPVIDVEAWRNIADAFTEAAREITVTFHNLSDELLQLFHGTGLLEVEPDPTPQQRALPRPSHTPPMWSHNPTKSRRRR